MAVGPQSRRRGPRAGQPLIAAGPAARAHAGGGRFALDQLPPRTQRVEILEIACWLLLAAGAVIGGLTFFSWRDGALALLSLPVLLLALWPRVQRRADLSTRRLITLALLLAALPLLYLLPLPLELAARLPGRAARLQAAIAELGPGQWTVLALAADDAWQAWLKLMPALALFLALLRFSLAQRHRLLAAILAVALLQALWGLAQLYAGSDSALLFYAVEAQQRASGAFANRSHFAGLLLLVLPLFAVLAGSGHWDWQQPPRPGWRLLGTLGLLLLIVALLASRSRAALGLLLVQGLLFCAWLLRQGHLSARLLAGVGALVLGLAMLLLAAPGALSGGLELGSADGRLGLWQRALDAALVFFPLGAGPGSFAGVFASFDTLDTLDKVYINHAHNDALELLFEFGAVGAALYLAALAALAAAFWRHALRRGADGLRWACTLGLAAVLLQGLVDYPLRAPLVAMTAAVLLGVLLAPREAARPRGAAP